VVDDHDVTVIDPPTINRCADCGHPTGRCKCNVDYTGQSSPLAPPPEEPPR
jgi:hypothetical protein